MGRYLLYISYIGTGFRGLQKQSGATHIKTVVGVLEEALGHLKPANEINVVTSSRTDAGVHALCTAVHVDLIPQEGSPDYDTALIQGAVNNSLFQLQEPIRIMNTLRVADNFHARFQAVGRQYVYRTLMCKDPDQWGVPFPLLESQRTGLVRGPMNFDLIKEAAGILQGKHDFSFFTKPANLKKQPWVNPVKNLEIQVEKSETFLEKYMQTWVSEHYQAVDFTFKSHSFLYRQVLKMVSTILSVGGGFVTLNHLQNMLDDPQNCPPVENQHIYKVPPWGLYLTNVFYEESDLQWPRPESSDNKEAGPDDQPHPEYERSYVNYDSGGEIKS